MLKFNFFLLLVFGQAPFDDDPTDEFPTGGPEDGNVTIKNYPSAFDTWLVTGKKKYVIETEEEDEAYVNSQEIDITLPSNLDDYIFFATVLPHENTMTRIVSEQILGDNGEQNVKVSIMSVANEDISSRINTMQWIAVRKGWWQFLSQVTPQTWLAGSVRVEINKAPISVLFESTWLNPVGKETPDEVFSQKPVLIYSLKRIKMEDELDDLEHIGWPIAVADEVSQYGFSIKVEGSERNEVFEVMYLAMDPGKYIFDFGIFEAQYGHYTSPLTPPTLGFKCSDSTGGANNFRSIAIAPYDEPVVNPKCGTFPVFQSFTNLQHSMMNYLPNGKFSTNSQRKYIFSIFQDRNDTDDLSVCNPEPEEEEIETAFLVLFASNCLSKKAGDFILGATREQLEVDASVASEVQNPLTLPMVFGAGGVIALAGGFFYYRYRTGTAIENNEAEQEEES